LRARFVSFLVEIQGASINNIVRKKNIIFILNKYKRNDLKFNLFQWMMYLVRTLIAKVFIYSGGVAAFVFYRKVYEMNVAAVFPALWGKLCKNSFYLPGVYGKEGIRPCLLVTRKLPHCWSIIVIYPKEIQQVKSMAQLKLIFCTQI
jgi:hypothetical protein